MKEHNSEPSVVVTGRWLAEIQNGEHARIIRYQEIMNYATDMDGDKYQKYSDIASIDDEYYMESIMILLMFKCLDVVHGQKLFDLLINDSKCINYA